MTLSTGLHRGVPFPTYLALDAFSSGRLCALNESPLHYQANVAATDDAATPAMQLGQIFYSATLTPDEFAATYVLEPEDLSQFGDGPRPKATKKWAEFCDGHRAAGRVVVTREQSDTVTAMVASVRGNKHAMKLLDRCPDREVSVVWNAPDGRLCRTRPDLLGAPAVANLKSCRDLSRFSPWTISDFGYWLQAAWEVIGLRACGVDVRHYFYVAVESVPPFDSAVFALDDVALQAGEMRAEQLLGLLSECEARNEWPGRYPNVTVATISDRLAEQLAGEEVA